MGKNGSYNLGFTPSNEDIIMKNAKVVPENDNNTLQNDKNNISEDIIMKNAKVVPENDKNTLQNDKNNISEIDQDCENGPKRATWGNGLEFLMSCISLSVGLGNIWRFPFTAYENGGGAFLIPYFIVLILIGKPMYYFEMIIGQFTSKGSVEASSVILVLKGVAIGQQLGVLCIVTYYVSLIALTLFYMIKSFSSQLPWSYCWEKWNDTKCIPSDPKLQNDDRENGVSSSELFYIREVIKQKDDLYDGIGLPDWQLTLWLFFAWIVVYFVIIKGIRSSGKVSYFLALFPYVVLITLLVRATTLNGTWEGIKYFITPDFKKILDPKVWYSATTQLFFSLSVGQGTIVMFSSFNRFEHNIYRDAIIVTTMDTFTSLLGGFTIFGILGNLAYNIGEPDISKVIKSGGAGLAFISYPDAISKFEYIPQFFAVLFFFMLACLGVGSAVGLQSGINANLKDIFPKAKDWKISAVTCTFGLIIGLVYVTPGGQWMLNLVDHFGGTFLVFTLAIFHITGVMWIYGLENFCWDAEFMLNRKVTLFWRVSWMIITPVLLIIIYIYFLIQLENPTFMDKEYPFPILTAGWVIFGVGVIQVIIWSLWLVLRDPNKLEALKCQFKQNPNWGPKSPKIFKEWMQYKNEKLLSRRNQSEHHSKVKKFFWILLGKYD